MPINNNNLVNPRGWVGVHSFQLSTVGMNCVKNRVEDLVVATFLRNNMIVRRTSVWRREKKAKYLLHIWSHFHQFALSTVLFCCVLLQFYHAVKWWFKCSQYGIKCKIKLIFVVVVVPANAVHNSLADWLTLFCDDVNTIQLLQWKNNVQLNIYSG